MGLCLGRRELGWLVAGSLLVSCGKPEHEPSRPAPVVELEAKRDLYAALLPSVADPDGFIEWTHCDSIHFTALVGASGIPVNLRAAIDETGKVHRRPPRHPECYPEFSKSENSKDVFVMLLLYGLVERDLALLEHVFDYGKAHGWVMGEGPLSRSYLTPTLQGQYAQAIGQLGGKSHPEGIYPQVWTPGLTGYQAHLQVISILAYGLTFGAVNDVGLDRLREHAHRQPRNPFFTAAYYRYSGDEGAKSKAIESLLDDRLWPIDRLPTSADRCESWLIQRDEGDGWTPCPERGRTHSGGDFLFSHAVLTGRI